jgi:TRAP-type C4-dicarboxylate transport system substrate-binding protein
MAGIHKGLLMTREIGYAPWIIGYVWKNPEHPVALTCSKEWYEMEDRLAKTKWNMKPLANGTIGNWDYWSRKPITAMKGFQGKKVYSYGELASVYIAAWGAKPVMASFGEMYLAFNNNQLHVISSSIGLFHDFKFYEGGRYYLNMPTYPPGSVGIHYQVIYMNRDKWNSLPVAYKKIILDAVDLMSWAGTFESLCMERLNLYRLINQYKVVDMGISTRRPKEYEKIRKAAVEAGKKYVFTRGATRQQWEEAQKMLAKYGDPKITSQYRWWYELARAEADRRMDEIKKALADGKSWEEAYDPYHPKHRYKRTAEQIKKAWLAVPRVRWEWDEKTRLR